MSQSRVACYIVRFTALPDDEAARTLLRHLLRHAGFATTIADADGIPQRLAENCYALTSAQEKADVEHLAQTVGQQALGHPPQAEVLLCDEYFAALRLARATARAHCQHP